MDIRGWQLAPRRRPRIQGADAAAKMLDSSVEPERFAERVVVLLDSAEGLMARTHRLSEQLRSAGHLNSRNRHGTSTSLHHGTQALLPTIQP